MAWSRAARFGWIAVGYCAIVLPVTAVPPQQSISTSRQFIVYGTDVPVRGAICDLAERTKRELLSFLGQKDTWATPIVINARYPQANLPELPTLSVDLGQTGFGLKLQLDLVIGRAVNPPEIRRELLRALLLEMMYRGESQIPAGATYVSPPGWLLDGIPSEQSQLERERVAAVLFSSAISGNVWPLHKFVLQRPELLDAAARNLYRAYSFALVDLLSHSANGSTRLTQFVLDLARASNDPMAELREHFPEIFGTESAETIWQQHLARLSMSQPYQLLSSAETERRLDESLRLRISDRGSKRSFELTEFPVFLQEKAARNALKELAGNLTALATRAHPVYAPIIAEYAHVVATLQRGKTLTVARRLNQLAAARRSISEQMRGIDDYLNWFEATNVTGPSGQFDDYLKAADRAARPERTKKDSISIYLDALEAQFDDDKAAIR